MGHAYEKANLIWVSPNHETAESVRDTLAHEFIHFRFPYLSHGLTFEAYKENLLKGEDLGEYKKRNAKTPEGV